jgi:uncharacterized membrane protein
MALAPEETRADEEKETGRVEAFSDGVIAIAVTLLILEIKVPTPDATVGVGLLSRLLALWPSFLAFVMSFATILVMWVNHHRIFRLVRTTDYPFLFWNGFLLLMITFVPFPTAVLAQHLTGPDARTATALYAGTFLVIALAFDAVWRYLRTHPRLLLTSADREEIARITAQYRFGAPLYALALVLSFVSVALAVATCLALAIFFACADLPRRHETISR